ncbi:MAG: fibronectin type III domain-containing protein, partial [bacterium]|nr:fibronectin type III domain-containing protein [bacterium]
MTPAAVTIMWWNNTNAAGAVGYAAGRVEYGKTGYELSNAADNMTTNAFAGQTGIVHRITLENLEANSDYLYRVICGGATNASSLHTYPADTDITAPVSFAVQGDESLGQSGWGYDITYRAFCNWQAALNPSAFLVLGDIVSFGEPLISNAWHNYFANGAPLLAKCPSYIALGQAEYKAGVLATGYDAAFSVPANGPANPADHTYSFDCGPAHVTVIEMNKETLATPDTAQFGWVTNDLARTSKPWKIVMLHHTIFTSGKYNVSNTYYKTSGMLTNYYVPAFEKYNVNV